MLPAICLRQRNCVATHIEATRRASDVDLYDDYLAYAVYA